MFFGYFTQRKLENKPKPALVVELGPEYASREGEKLLITTMTYSAIGPTITFRTDEDMRQRPKRLSQNCRAWMMVLSENMLCSVLDICLQKNKGWAGTCVSRAPSVHWSEQDGVGHPPT